MEKLKLLFKGINLTEFCEEYQFSYNYVRKVFKGKYELSADMEAKLLEAFGRYLKNKQEIYNS